MNQIKVNGLTRVTRATAKYEGNGEATFDYIDNSAYFYNCHDSRGNQMFYYIDDEVASGLGK